MKKIFLTLLFISSVSIAADFSKDDFIKLLFINRTNISEKYQTCKPDTFGKLIVSCGGSDVKKTFDTLINVNQSLDDWYKNSEKIIIAFMHYYRSAYKNNNSGVHLVNDDFLVKLMILSLSDTTKNKEKIRCEALDFLLNATTYNQLNKNSELLRDVLSVNKIDNPDILKLFVLTNKSEKEKNLLLKKTDKLYIFARLGDTLAEDSVLSKFNNKKKYSLKSKYVDDLIFIGSIKAKRALIST